MLCYYVLSYAQSINYFLFRWVVTDIILYATLLFSTSVRGIYILI